MNVSFRETRTTYYAVILDLTNTTQHVGIVESDDGSTWKILEIAVFATVDAEVWPICVGILVRADKLAFAAGVTIGSVGTRPLCSFNAKSKMNESRSIPGRPERGENPVNARRAAEEFGVSTQFISAIKRAMGIRSRFFFLSSVRRWLAAHPQFRAADIYSREVSRFSLQVEKQNRTFIVTCRTYSDVRGEGETLAEALGTAAAQLQECVGPGHLRNRKNSQSKVAEGPVPVGDA